MTQTKSISAKLIVGFTVVAMLFSVSFRPAQAQTSEELQAQINSLLATIASLQAQLGGSTSGGASASMTFTRDLTLGSTGADVTALQNWLMGKGHAIPAGATGYFGAQTKAALAAYQAANGISPAAGYFGPVTRAKVNASGGGTTGGGTTGGGSSDLEGGAGSVDTYELMSGLNNEEVGEDEEDVEVAGLSIEADDGSDLEITAVRLVFDEGTANQDFADYASEVSIMLDGEEFARLDADEFNDDNEWTKTVSLDDGAIIEAGEKGELTVAVSGVSNLDTNDAGDTWTVDFRQVRFKDADGTTISEDPSTATRTFSFEAFATAANVELKIKANDDDDVNDARTIEVDATDDTDDVEVLSFTLEAEGDSDITIDSLPISATTTESTGNDPDDLISELTLWVDGEEVGSESLSTSDSDNSGEVVVFDDLDWTIGSGDTAEVVVKAKFFSIADSLDEGDTVNFSFGEQETDNTTNFDAEDESGTQLTDAKITGSATAGDFELRSVGIKVTLVSTDATVSVDDGSDDDAGTFEITFLVEAFGGDVYVSNSPTPTTATSITASTIATNGILYYVDQGGTVTVEDMTDVISFTTDDGATDSSDNILLNEGETSELTLTAVRQNDTDAVDNGIFRVLLKAIGWASTDTTTFQVYDFNLEDFKTKSINLD